MQIFRTVLTLLMLSALSHANPECVGFYNLESSSSIVEKFANYSQKRQGESPAIIIDDFISSQVERVYNHYDQQIVLATRVGTESKLQSRLKVGTASVSSATRALDTLENIVDAEVRTRNAANEKRRFHWLSLGRSFDFKKAETAVEALKTCKSNLDSCAQNIRTAVEDSSKNLVLIDRLIFDLQSLSREVDELKENLGQSPVFSAYSSIAARHSDSLERKIGLMKTNAELERTKVIEGLFFRDQIPEFDERIDVLLAKSADTPVHKIWAEKMAHTAKPEGIIGELAKMVLSIRRPEEKFKYIRDLSMINHLEGKKVFTAEEAIKIIESGKFDFKSKAKIPFKLENLLGQAVWTNYYYYSLPEIEYRPLLAIFLLRITRPSNDPMINLKLYALGFKLFETATEDSLKSDIENGRRVSKGTGSTLTSQFVLTRFKEHFTEAVRPFFNAE